MILVLTLVGVVIVCAFLCVCIALINRASEKSPLLGLVAYVTSMAAVIGLAVAYAFGVKRWL